MRAKLLITVCFAAVLVGCNTERPTASTQNASRSTESTKHLLKRDNTPAKSDRTESPADNEDKSWTIQGVVVDRNGALTDEYDAASIWSSNGKYWNEDGVVPMEERESIWKKEGVLANRPQFSAQKTRSGKFSLKINNYPRAPVFAVNAQRTHGGIALVDRESSKEPVTVRMTPLTRVTAELFCPEAGKRPTWGRAYIYIAGGGPMYLTSCGTFQGRVSFLLPAGDYEISAEANSPISKMAVPEKPSNLPFHAVFPRGKRFTVPSNISELDLGVLALDLPKDSSGNSVDTTTLYGNRAPKISIVDARGVASDVKLEEFHGKWVLLDFWAIWCPPCVARNLPELTAFYADHVSQREQFEILAICNTSNENIRTIAEYEKRTANIRKTHWNGKQLPFPVLIDGEGRTYRDYGVSGWPTTFLIDPEGRLIEGGSLQMLGDRLQELREAEN